MNFGKVAFVVALPLLASGTWAAMEFKEAEITTIKNMVEHDPGTGAAPAKVSEKIYEKSTVSTAAASMAELTFADSSITRMGSSTQFSFRSKERLVKLDQGTILIHTPPGNGGAKVEAGGVTASVTGTTFMASRDGVGNVMFVLLEGQGGLKVTAGGSTKVIRPGQAASIGADAVAGSGKTTSDAPGGGAPKDAQPGAETSRQTPENGSSSSPAADSPEPTPVKPVEIKVFEVDVKKVVTTSPLVTEFKTELPSAKKIEATIQVQESKLQEGKLEKTEAEVVAVVPKDGDLLVGAPKVEKEEMVVVNRKETVEVKKAGGNMLDAETAAGGNNLDVETAAGPGTGGGAASVVSASSSPSPASGTAPTTPTPISTAPGNAGQIANGNAGLIRTEPTSMSLVFSANQGTILLDQAVGVDRIVNLNLPGVSSVVIPAGSRSVNFAFDPKEMFTGAPASTVITAVSGNLQTSATMAQVLATPGIRAAITAANPIRAMLSPASSPTAELAALDNYFYFSGRATGSTGGPSSFFADAAALQLLANYTAPVTLGFAGQNYELYTAQQWQAGGVAAVTGGLSKKIFYGDRMNFSAATGQWNGLSTWNGTTPPVSVSDNLWDLFLGRLADAPAAAGLVWDDRGGSLSSTSAQINAGLDFQLSMAAGSLGGSVQGMGMTLDQGSVDFTSAGILEMKSTRISGIGAPVAPVGQPQRSGELTLEAVKTVKLGAQSVAGVAPTAAQAAEQQVRLEAVDTSSGGTGTGIASMAVIRTGDSLELRNVVIRDFTGAKLEKVTKNTDGTTTLNGRVLMSGSAVRDFKIKELVGAAVNADAKIQMMAMDANGGLAGEMKLEGQLPVAAKLAKELDGTLSGPVREKPVHAFAMDFAAKSIDFNNSTLTAMNSITARANTVIVQNSFMTVVRASGMINMYVREGAVNLNYGSVRDGYANFAGANTFQFGNVAFNISNQTDLNQAYGTRLFDTQNSGGAVAGAVNVLRL